MHADNFSLARYFDRIGYAGPAHADLATVSELMRRQLYTVPFENLDVQAGLGVSLAPEDIADKILARGRGGYCYEVNGLFCMAMQALGVPYRYVAARPCSIPRVVPAPTWRWCCGWTARTGCATWASAATASERP